MGDAAQHAGMVDDAVGMAEQVHDLAYPPGGDGGKGEWEHARRLAVVTAIIVALFMFQFFTSRQNTKDVLGKMDAMEKELAKVAVTQAVATRRVDDMQLAMYRLMLEKRQSEIVHNQIFRLIGHPELIGPVDNDKGGE